MRGLRILSAATALVVGGTSDAFGQDKPPAAKADSGCTTYPGGRIECIRVRGGNPGDSLINRVFFRHDSAMMKRAALGVELRPTGTRRDTLGVFVAAVTPRGPAETAGIIEGDRIAAINGVDVRSVAADVDDPYTNRLASHRLTKEVHKLTPGARVTLRVYSGGRFRDVVVTAGRASEVLRQAGGFNFGFPGGPGAFEFHGPDGAMMLRSGTPMRLEGMDPALRTRIRSLPRTEFRRMAPTRVRTVRPGVVTMLDRDDAGTLIDADEEMIVDELPDADSDLLDIDNDLLDIDIEPIGIEEIRELVARTVRDAIDGLRTLATLGLA